MAAGWDLLVIMAVCYTGKGVTVKKSATRRPIAAFSSHLLGFQPLSDQFIAIAYE
jgi:hypothetical protein